MIQLLLDSLRPDLSYIGITSACVVPSTGSTRSPLIRHEIHVHPHAVCPRHCGCWSYWSRCKIPYDGDLGLKDIQASLETDD